MAISAQQQLAQVEHEVRQRRQALTDTEARIQQFSSELTRAHRSTFWPSFVISCHNVANAFPAKAAGLCVIVGVGAFAHALVVTHLVTGSVVNGATAGVAATIAAVAVLYVAVFRIDREAAIDRRAESHSRVDTLTRELATAKSAESAEQRAIDTLEKRAADIRSSTRLELERLADANWRAMRGVELEMYLLDVFRAQGNRPELTKTSGDQGVDLIVETDTAKVAVQVKGYHNSVSNGAVQEAVAGMRMYGCSACAVITNSRFTASAQELAAANTCVLIGEDEFRGFVLGEIPIA